MKTKFILLGCLVFALILGGCKKDDEEVVLKSIKVNPTTVTLTVGNTQQITATAEPTGAKMTPVWSSNDVSIATVSDNGLITAVKAGNTTVQVKSGNISASVSVTVETEAVPLTDLKVTPEEITLKIDETETLDVTLVPTNATDITVTYESSNTGIATVSAAGEVKAVGVGSTVIKVKGGAIEKEVPVTVTVKDFSVSPESVKLEVGDEQQLTMTTDPAEAEGVSYTFESSAENIATVSETGLIKAVAIGEAVITVTTGGISKEVAVEVIENDRNNPEKENWKSAGASTVWQDIYAIEKAFDADNSSYWHSDAAASTTMPQWIAVDMGLRKNIDGFLFTNRQDKGETSRPKDVKFEISDDGETWETVYENSELPNLLQQQIIPLGAQKTARYFKMTVNSTWSNANYTYIAELGIYAGTSPAPDPGPEVDEPDNSWSAEASSEMTSAMGLIDGNINNPWHSGVQGDPQPYAIIDFKEAKTVYGLNYNGRVGPNENDINASPKHIIFSMSDDKTNWQTLLEIDNLINMPLDRRSDTQQLYADAPKTGRYLKVEIRSNWAGAPYSYIGELGILETAATKVSFPLEFTEVTDDTGQINNMTLDRQGDYVILKTDGGTDPYVMTKSLPEDAGFDAEYFYVRMKYKSSVAISNAEWYFFATAGFYATGQALQYNVAEDWTEWQLFYETRNGFGDGNAIRIDLPDGHDTDFFIKDLEIVTFK